MISGVLVYSSRGELVLNKFFKNSLKRSISDIFRVQVINNLDVRSPVLTLGSTTFHHIRSRYGDNLWLVTITRSNANSAAIWEFLYKLDAVMNAYRLDREEALKEEFMIVHEMLDIMLGGNGIPIDTELNSVIAQMSVKPVRNMGGLLDSPDGNDVLSSSSSPTSSAGELHFPKFLTKRSSSFLGQGDSTSDFYDNNKITWRPKGIIHKKDEVFLYVNERINILVSRDGSILKSYVDGTIDITTHLSGTPICRFGLNDSLGMQSEDEKKWLAQQQRHSGSDFGNKNFIPKAAAGSVLLEDCKFHECVSLDKFNRNHIIEFVPPDGSMELMKYHVRDNINLPFKVTPIVTHSTRDNEIDYRITLKSLFPGKLSAKDVVLHIPVPPSTVDCKISVSNGHCKFVPEENAMIWRFNKYNGLTENTLSAVTVSTSDTTQLNLQQWTRPPISLEFEVMMFSNSGLVVRYFTISGKDSKHRAVKWIKYISKAGSYEVRY
ncbi:BCE_3a_G0048400.mRNA.1.CDS.1 [Saccharomyces cerevisiae]|nr:BCE_3a_G0048400.mRNA.1.CDS.1 [Saccharomyces cerevisiae]CAI7328683.1 BCE_3a_G0048400.mRNA.1.CDS.1 [Saccharomyces cerevisiae]